MAVLLVTVSSMPSSRSLLKQNKKSFPQLASTSSGYLATEQNLQGLPRSQLHPFLLSFLAIPYPYKEPQVPFQLSSGGASYRYKNPRVKSRAGWLGEGRKNR